MTSSPNIVDDAESSSLESTHAEQSLPNDVLEKMNIAPPIGTTPAVPLKKEKPNIFISHGKNNAIIIGNLKSYWHTDKWKQLFR